MGCCLSSKDHHHDHPHRQSSGSREPPPASPLEEETVKEVLLETTVVPIPKAGDDRIKVMPPKVESQPVLAPPEISGIHNSVERETVSEVSEMCSYNESFSNATTERKDGDEEDDGEVNQRPPVKRRRGPGPTGGRGRGRGDRVSSRRPSPDRRGQVAPLRPSRGRPIIAGQPRNVAGRKDPGEGSCRRSRSPVRHRDDDVHVSDQDKSVATTPEPPCAEVVEGEEAESLENPVVSLECFIFL